MSQTTAVSMAWCLLMLAKHPAIQQKARDEVMSVLSTAQPLTYENLDKLESVSYTHLTLPTILRV